MDFFTKIFDGLASLSAKLPKVEVGTFFIIALAVLAIAGVIAGLTFLVSPPSKVRRSIRKISEYLEDCRSINDDNAADFTSECFGNSAPRAFREAWVQYLGVRFGYPSDIISEKDVFDREVRKSGMIQANVFIGIALIIVAAFAYWGMGSLGGPEMGVIVGAGLLLSGIIYIVLVLVARGQFKKARTAFYEMQDDLDAKVNLQVEKNYATDASPLLEVAAIVDEIIAKNTYKAPPSMEEEMPDEEMSDSQDPTTETTSEESVQAEVIDETEENEPVGEAESESDNTVSEESDIDRNPEDNPEVNPEEETISAPSEEIAEEEGEIMALDSESEETTGEEETEPAFETEDSAEGMTEAGLDEEIAVTAGETADAGADITAQGEEEICAKEQFVPNGEEPDETVEEDEPESGEGTEEPAIEEESVEAAEDENAEDDLSGEIADAEEAAAEEINDEDEEAMFGKRRETEPEFEAEAFEDIYAESELIEDEEEQPVLQDLAEPAATDTLPIPEEAAAEEEALPELEPEVIIVEENLDEGDEDIKAPRLAKLPHLVDYVLTMNLSRGMKIKVAMLMLQAYNVFKNSPENKAIVIQCLTKIMAALKA